jgi:hypothetical protein
MFGPLKALGLGGPREVKQFFYVQPPTFSAKN